MELNHLKYFFEVARMGSFTKASKELHVSQPSISKTIKLLEDREGFKLLDRTKRSVQLTPMGKLFYKKCETVFQELENLKTEVEIQKKGWVGNLCLGASDNLCNYVLPSLFNKFCKQYPQIKANLMSATSREIKSELLTRHLELGIFYTHPREVHFVAQKIGFVEFVIVASKKMRLNDLNQTPHIGCAGVEYIKSYPVLKMLKSLSIQPTLGFEASSQETQKRLAQEGLGYAVLPRFMVTQEIKKGTLWIFPTEKHIGSEIYLVTRKNHTLSKPAQVFSEFVIKNILSHLYGVPAYAMPPTHAKAA